MTANLLRGMLRDERRALTVSRVQEGVFGLEDVALSLPTVVGAEGASMVMQPELDDVEEQALHRSAGVLRDAIESVSGA